MVNIFQIYGASPAKQDHTVLSATASPDTGKRGRLNPSHAKRPVVSSKRPNYYFCISQGSVATVLR